MAILTPVTDDVRPIGVGTTTTVKIAGEAFDRGDILYLDATVQRYKKASNANATVAAVTGAALSPSTGNGDYFILQSGGSIYLGVASVVAEKYVLSSTAGRLESHSDLTTGDLLSEFGYGKTASEIVIDINNTGISVP